MSTEAKSGKWLLPSQLADKCGCCPTSIGNLRRTKKMPSNLYRRRIGIGTVPRYEYAPHAPAEVRKIIDGQ